MGSFSAMGKRLKVFYILILLLMHALDVRANLLSDIIRSRYHKYDILHETLRLSIDNKNQKIHALAAVKLQAGEKLKSVYFLLNMDFEVESVSRSGIALNFSKTPVFSPLGLLRVGLDTPADKGEVVTLFIHYVIQFKTEPSFLPKSFVGAEGVELRGMSLWFPTMLDEECTFRLAVEAPEGEIPVGTGELLGIKKITEKKAPPKFLYEYEVPKPLMPWVMSLYAHRYEKFSRPHRKVLFDVYVFKDQKKYVSRIFRDMAFVFDFCEKLFGAFPAKRHVFLAKKESGAFASYYHIDLSRREIKALDAKDEGEKLLWHRMLFHETGHLWTAAHGPLEGNAWLSEGLAEYLFYLAYARRFGTEKAERILKRWHRIYLATIKKNRDVPLSRASASTPVFFGVVYNKGAYVFHMLHGMLGDKAFYAMVRKFSLRFKWRMATLSDFKGAAAENVKNSVDGFLTDWVESAKRLDYSVSFVQLEKEKKGYAVAITIINRGEIFFPGTVELLIEMKKKTEKVNVRVTQKKEVFSFHVKDKVTRVELDPGWHVLDVHRENNIGLVK